MFINKKQKKSNSNKNKQLKAIKKTLKIIGTTLLSLFLILVITGSIVATALTVYVMNYMDSAPIVDLNNDNLSNTSIFYATNDEGENIPIYTMSGDVKRVPVNIENVPQHVQDAFIYAEDARFYYHEGVDFKRTFAAFANYIFSFWDNAQGGSSITQQTIKNITMDNEQSPTRKIREVFSALNLEKNYTKTDILEAYMNVASFHYNMQGIQTAANFYFDKDVSQLTIAEAACLVAITKSPKYNNPIDYPENNKARQQYILGEMYKYGAISSEEYEAALSEELTFIGYNKVTTDDTNEEAVVSSSPYTSYFVDAAIEDAIAVLMDEFGISRDVAQDKLKNEGYRIYTTVDLNIQSQLEEKFKDPKTLFMRDIDNLPQSAFIVMDYKGNVLGVVGGTGEKQESRGFNRATQAARSPGSTIKPIAIYGPAIQYDLISWSTVFTDEPLKIYNSITGLYEPYTFINDDGEEVTEWPSNYSNTYTYKDNYAWYYLSQSINTVAAQIGDRLTPEGSYNFLKDRLHISTLSPNDISRSPMAVGGMTNGIILEELAAAYQPFGNLGKYYEPTYITRITDSKGKVVIDHKYTEEQPFSSDSAYVMNRMLRKVTTAGTGTAAANGLTVEVIGKTGTSQDWENLLFVGLTPDYVTGLWYGYDEPAQMPYQSLPGSAAIWNNVFKDIANTGTKKTFDVDPTVVELHYCTKTGLIAGENCPESTDTGYYKASNSEVCTVNHSYDTEFEPADATQTPTH